MNNRIHSSSVSASKRVASAACAVALLAVAAPASAYIGPGAGLSLLGALWAVVAAVAAALFFVLAWPLRRMMKRRKEEAQAEHTDHAELAPAAVAKPQPAPRHPRH